MFHPASQIASAQVDLADLEEQMRDQVVHVIQQSILKVTSSKVKVTSPRPPDRLHGTFCRACRPPAAAKNNSYTPCVFVIYHRRGLFSWHACVCFCAWHAFVFVRGMHVFLRGMHFLCVACMCFVCPQHLWQCASWSIVNTTYSKACLIASRLSPFLSQGQQGSGLFLSRLSCPTLSRFISRSPGARPVVHAGNSLAVVGLPTDALAGAGR